MSPMQIIDLMRSQSSMTLLLSGIIVVSQVGICSAQRGSSSKSKSSGNVTVLDQKAEQAQDEFMQATAELARDYEELGEIEKAQEALRMILKLKPDARQIQEKINELEETRISANEATLTIDASKGWTQVEVGVEKEKKMRFESTGDFRFIYNETIGPDGIGGDDVKTDLITAVPLGALMGMIVGEKGKTTPPFLIGQKSEVTSEMKGQLFVRVNTPPNAKCIGKIQLRITGDVIVPETTGRSRK